MSEPHECVAMRSLRTLVGGEKSSSWNVDQEEEHNERLATLAMTTVSLFVGVALLAGDGIGYAQQRSDNDNVNVIALMGMGVALPPTR